MKVIKAFVFTVLAAGSMIACGSALAQDSTGATAPTPSTNAPPMHGHGHAMMKGMTADRLAQVLNLTDDQKAQVQPILKAQAQQMRDVHKDTSLSADERKAKIKEIMKDTTTQLQAILTPEQMTKWHNLVHPHKSAPKTTPTSDMGTNAPAGS
ncbi:MAG TPA: hypothetical protein VH280_08380 [Verrucomicrobiae bacterium]|jgi:Spy/CpxP family protein refolding chaperone|nr:hypothetical protein [Verrucomicrobiae bacterium]